MVFVVLSSFRNHLTEREREREREREMAAMDNCVVANCALNLKSGLIQESSLGCMSGVVLCFISLNWCKEKSYYSMWVQSY